ncbi:MAG: hypothetical protein U9R08_05770, partial [Nanoarchaeota archaeon]|nr:hypothetical protein [Nanoarchaeota archaeon]
TENISFKFTVTDDNATNCTLYHNGTGTFVANKTIYDSEIYEGSISEINVSGFTNNGNYIWNVECYDNDSLNASATANFTFTLDTDAPAWSNNDSSPASGVEYSPDTLYHFNITWIDNVAVDNVIFEFNGVNYTFNDGEIENTGNDFNITISDLSATSYTYYWYANDTAGNLNVTDALAFTVAQGTSVCYLEFDPSGSTTYGYGLNASCYCSNGGENLYRNDTDVTSTENNINITYGIAAGNWEYVCNVSTTTNYTSASNSSNYTINKATSEINLSLNGIDNNITIEAGELANIYSHLVTPSSGYIEVYNDSVMFISGQSPLSNSGIYITPNTHNISAYYPETENYTSSYEEHNLTILDTTDPVVTVITPIDDDLVGWTVVLRGNATDINLDSVWYEAYNGTLAGNLLDTNIMNSLGGEIYNGTLYTNDTWPYPISLQNFTNLTLVVYANDTEGNIGNDLTYWTLDNTVPGIQHITPPQTGAHYNSDFNLDIHVSNTWLNFSEYNITNESGTQVLHNSVNLATNQYVWNDLISVSSLPDGNYTITTYAVDKVGNSNNKSTWFYVDGTPPNVTEISDTGWVLPTPVDAIYTNIQSHTLNLTCNESFPDTQWIEFDNVNNSVEDGSKDIFYWWNYGPLTEGIYTYTGYCNDTAGNQNQAETRTLTIDLSAPAYSNNESPTTPVTYTSDATYHFNITWIDNYQLDDVIFEFNGVNYTNIEQLGNDFNITIFDLAVGTYTYFWYANDTAGNMNVTYSNTLSITQATSICYLTFDPESSTVYNEGVNATCSCTNVEISETLYRNNTDVSSTENQINYTNIAAGNWEYICNVSATTNYTSASNSSNYTINKAQSEVNLLLNGTDANYTVETGDNVNITGYLVTGQGDISLYENTSLINSGSSPLFNITNYASIASHNITLYYFETENYSSTEETHYIDVTDLTPPSVVSVSATSPVNQTEVTNITATITDASGVSTAIARIYAVNGSVKDFSMQQNGGDVWFYEFTPSAYEPAGIHNVTIMATDIYSNVNDTETTTFTVLDITPPTVNIILPVLDTLINYSASVTINASVLDETALDTVLANITWDSTYQIITLTDPDYDDFFTGIFTNTNNLGNYNVTIIANDTSNNINDTETTNFTVVDQEPPVILTTTIDPSLVIVDNDVFINASASDNFLVDMIWADISLPNNSIKTRYLSNNDNNYTTNITGEHNVTFYANDTSGNLVNATGTFNVAQAFAFNLSVIDFNLTGQNVTATFYSLNTSSQVHQESFEGNALITLPNGTYDLSVYSYDSIDVKLLHLILDLNNPTELGLDKLETPVTGYLVTYGLNDTLISIGGANITINYTDLSYGTESNLLVHGCDNWNFTEQICEGTWSVITASQNTTDKTFYFHVDTLEAYSILETTTPSTGGGGGATTCTESWSCGSWTPSECPPSGIQTRECVDSNLCGTSYFKPSESRTCIYILPEEEVIEEEVVDYDESFTPDAGWITDVKIICNDISSELKERIDSLLRFKEESPTNSQFTEFDYLLGINDEVGEHCTIDFETEYLCVGFDYNLYKCTNWDFETGICRDENYNCNEEGKIDVCHVPADDPSKEETITISCNALDAHLAQGDSVGTCEDKPWKTILEMTPGLQKYTVHLDKGDPGLGIGPSPITRNCGDGICNYGELCSNCQDDCGSCSVEEAPVGFFARIARMFRSITGGAVVCDESWTCSDWGSWDETGFRTRTCKDSSNCGTTLAKPSERERCPFIDHGCSNGIKDQTETGVDCGGVCAPCLAAPYKFPMWIILIIIIIIISFILFILWLARKIRRIRIHIGKSYRYLKERNYYSLKEEYALITPLYASLNKRQRKVIRKDIIKLYKTIKLIIHTDNLIIKARKYVHSHRFKLLRHTYIQIKHLYESLPKEQRPLLRTQIIKLYRKVYKLFKTKQK